MERLLGEWGIPQDSAAGRAHFALGTEARRAAEDPAELKKIRRGWCYGSPEFRRELLERLEKGLGKHHGGPERQETAMAKAERLLAEELRRRKVRPEDLAGRPKGDRQKAWIALRLREQTTMTWDWIAEKLAMGVGAHAAHCVRGLKTRKENPVMRD